MTEARCNYKCKPICALRALATAVLMHTVHSTWFSLRGDQMNSGSFSSSVRLVEDPSVASRRTISSWGLHAAPLLSSRHGLTYVVAAGPLGGVAAWTSTCSQKVGSAGTSRYHGCPMSRRDAPLPELQSLPAGPHAEPRGHSFVAHTLNCVAPPLPCHVDHIAPAGRLGTRVPASSAVNTRPNS